jgi:uncharacterized membrane protein YkvA (DUF1232 family)
VRLPGSPRGGPLARLKHRARLLKRDTYALYLAARDRRTPWYARLLATAVVAYAFSPLDLIPDFLPVVGYLDDLIIVPLGIALVLRLVPPEVLAESRERADEATQRPTSRVVVIVVLGIWVGLALLVARWAIGLFVS